MGEAFPANAADPSKNLCGSYIKSIVKRIKVIPEIIWAVSKTESTYRGQPWPWSINLNGKSYYFKDRKALNRFLDKTPKHKRKQIDIGCMQLNYQYHGWKFKNIKDMADPQKNMIFGSLYLYELFLKEKIRQLKKKVKNPKKSILHDYQLWGIAVGKYHSKTQKRGRKYAQNVMRHIAHQPSLRKDDDLENAKERVRKPPPKPQKIPKLKLKKK
jgi:YHS domain-containing protein